MILRKRQIILTTGARLELDGASDDSSILCEAWAHQGRPKAAQRAKVLVDAFKLLYAARVVSRSTRKILLFSDETAAKHFREGTWAAKALVDLEIEIMVVELPKAVRDAVIQAQKRQVMVSPSSLSSATLGASE
jgi:hypothetical protein